MALIYVPAGRQTGGGNLDPYKILLAGLSGARSARPARVVPGDPLFRLYGGGAKKLRRFYTAEDPRTMENPRAKLGLPKENTAERMVSGRLKSPPEGLPVGQAKPLQANPGGATEAELPNPDGQIDIDTDIPFELP